MASSTKKERPEYSAYKANTDMKKKRLPKSFGVKPNGQRRFAIRDKISSLKSNIFTDRFQYGGNGNPYRGQMKPSRFEHSSDNDDDQ